MKNLSVTHEIVHTNPNRDVLFEIFHDSYDIAERHWHNSVEMIYITRGTLFVTQNDHETRLDEGDCIIINSCVIHSTNGSLGNDSILVQFPTAFLSRYIPDFDHCYFDLETHNSEPRHQTKLLQIKTVLENMAVVEDIQPEGGFLRFNSLLFELLYELYHNFRVPVAPTVLPASAKMLEALTPVIDYTHDHYMEPISIDRVSSIAHLQPEYFCRKFRRLMGQTYLEYLNDVRLSYVYEDLIHTNLRLYEILDKHGFTNYKLFRRLFRKKFSCTPGELRKKNAANGITARGREHIQPQMFDLHCNDDQRTVRGL